MSPGTIDCHKVNMIKCVNDQTWCRCPESFTPDHKPIMGEDPRVRGFYHGCGFNSSGMMLGNCVLETLSSFVSNFCTFQLFFPYFFKVRVVVTSSHTGSLTADPRLTCLGTTFDATVRKSQPTTPGLPRGATSPMPKTTP